MNIDIPFEMFQGALVGLIFGIGALAIYLIPRFQWVLASLLLVLTTPLALLPFWMSSGTLGISDWDYYFSMHTNIQQTITTFHQFPLWNPYTCGGTSALGDPEFPALSPLFLLELLFGTPAGLKLSIYAFTAIGALGMLFLSKKIGIGVLGGLVAGLGFAFSSVNLLEIVEGHPNILSAMYIPWIWLTWYCAYTSKSKKQLYYIIATAMLLALVFFQGGLYLLMYLTGAFIVMPFLLQQPKKAIKVTLIAGVLALGLAAVKLAPVAYWVQEFQDRAYASSAYTLSSMDKILFGRILHGAEDVIPNQGSGWHEYGAYIGPVMFMLALIGIFAYRKNKIARGLLIAGTLALLTSSLGPYLKPFFDHVPFIPRSNISRVILFTIIPLSLLSGFGITWLTKKSRFFQVIAILLLTLASIDLISLAYPLSSQAFVLPKDTKEITEAIYPIQYTPFDYKTRHNGVDYTRSYQATLRGYGTLSYCSVLGPEPAVRIITDEGGDNFVSFPDNPTGTFEILSWTPNKTTVSVTTKQTTSAVINANYAKGWYVNGRPAKEIGNRVGADIPTGTSTLVFQYIPDGYYAGVWITIITTISLISLILYTRKKQY